MAFFAQDPIRVCQIEIAVIIIRRSKNADQTAIGITNFSRAFRPSKSE